MRDTLRTTRRLVAATFLCACHAAFASPPTVEQLEFFENEIRPLLSQHCFECHGDGKKPESGLRLTSQAAVLLGGDSGPAAIPGKVEESLLIKAVRYRELEMPPRGKLPAEAIAKFERWVAMGLPWPESSSPAKPATEERTDFKITAEQRAHWSFQPIVAQSPPTVREGAWPRGDIDRFILAKLESRELTPSPPADKRTLIRRVTFDLIGLPPTPAETAAFLADNSPAAFEKIVDRLLASRQYGERWGRHWLDVVRYADTAGDVSDYPVPQAYRYRDYVINAFYNDKPYDQFIREQLAGDLMAKESPPAQYAELTTATGYIAITRRFGYNRVHQQYLTISDTIDTLGKSVLGLSLGCARCHDHKFDPISANDYYALYGIFDSTVYPFPGAEEQNRPQDFVPLVPAPEAQALVATRDREVAELDAKIKVVTEQLNALKSQTAATPDDIALKAKVDQAAAALATTQTRRNELATKQLFATAYAVFEGTPHNSVVQRRGDPERPGPEVPRRFPEILGAQPVAPAVAESGRRQLAEWIVSPSNPLTSRVIVNRIWQHHFGRGLVRTPNDFGFRGQPPTHPELLDYLASQFMNEGWSIKRLHKQIVRSQTYQMASADRPEARSIDPNNDCIWRMEPQRLDAECIRDAMLTMSGQLDLSPAPAHPFPATETWVFNVHHPFKAVYDTNRRSVYLMTQRLQKHPFLGLFDGADPGATTDVRMTTTTPSQALFIMNDPFVHEQSTKFAQRLTGMSSDDATRINTAFELALGRAAAPAEIDAACSFERRYIQELAAVNTPESERPVAALAAYLRTVLGSNEFMYID